MERKTDWGLVAGGILLGICGLICLLYPGLVLTVITIVAGCGFLISGCFDLVTWVRTRKVLQMSGWALAYAVLDIVLGLMFLIHPIALSGVVSWVMGLFIIIFGVFEIAGCFKLKSMGLPIWGWMLASGIMTVLLGVCFFILPESLSILIGLTALLRGISMIVYGFAEGKMDVF